MRKPVLALLLVLYTLSLHAQDLNYAVTLKNQYKFDEAIYILDSLIRTDGDSRRSLMELADCYFQSGDFTRALDTYNRLSETYPLDLTCKVRMAVLASKTKDYDRVVEIGEKIAATDTIPAITSLVGDAFAQMLQDSSALSWYELTLKKKPKSAAVVSKMATLLLDKKDYDGILNVADNYPVLDSVNVPISLIKGKTLYLKKDYEASIKQFRHINQDLNDDSYYTHLFLGYSYYNLNRFVYAHEELLKAWERDSSDVTLALDIANVKAVLFQKGGDKYEKDVFAWYEKVDKMLSSSKNELYSIYFGKGKYLHNKDKSDFDGAIGFYKKTLQIKPDPQQCIMSIGNCYRRKKDYKNAKYWYEKFMEKAKPSTVTYEYVKAELQYIDSELFMLEGK